MLWQIRLWHRTCLKIACYEMRLELPETSQNRCHDQDLRATHVCVHECMDTMFTHAQVHMCECGQVCVPGHMKRSVNNLPGHTKRSVNNLWNCPSPCTSLTTGMLCWTSPGSPTYSSASASLFTVTTMNYWGRLMILIPRERAQLVRCLPCKHKVLNSIPRPHEKMPGMLVHT